MTSLFAAERTIIILTVASAVHCLSVTWTNSLIHTILAAEEFVASGFT